MRLATLPLVVLLAMVSWASGQITEGDWTYVVEKWRGDNHCFNRNW